MSIVFYGILLDLDLWFIQINIEAAWLAIAKLFVG